MTLRMLRTVSKTSTRDCLCLRTQTRSHAATHTHTAPHGHFQTHAHTRTHARASRGSRTRLYTYSCVPRYRLRNPASSTAMCVCTTSREKHAMRALTAVSRSTSSVERKSTPRTSSGCGSLHKTSSAVPSIHIHTHTLTHANTRCWVGGRRCCVFRRGDWLSDHCTRRPSQNLGAGLRSARYRAALHQRDPGCHCALSPLRRIASRYFWRLLDRTASS